MDDAQYLGTLLSIVILISLQQVCTDAAPLLGLCSQCPAGEGVLLPCSKDLDTQCSECPPGFYSNVTSAAEPCFVCSRCGSGLFELHPCNGTHDVFCELCSWRGAINNENYRTKCVGNDKTTDVDKKFIVNSENAAMLGDQPLDASETERDSVVGGENGGEKVVEGTSGKYINDTKAVPSLEENEKQLEGHEEVSNPVTDLDANSTQEQETADDPEDLSFLVDSDPANSVVETEAKNNTNIHKETSVSTSETTETYEELTTESSASESNYSANAGQEAGNSPEVKGARDSVIGEVDSGSGTEFASGDAGIVIGMVAESESSDSDPTTLAPRSTTTKPWTWPPVVRLETPEPRVEPEVVPVQATSSETESEGEWIVVHEPSVSFVLRTRSGVNRFKVFCPFNADSTFKEVALFRQSLFLTVVLFVQKMKWALSTLV